MTGWILTILGRNDPYMALLLMVKWSKSDAYIVGQCRVARVRENVWKMKKIQVREKQGIFCASLGA